MKKFRFISILTILVLISSIYAFNNAMNDSINKDTNNISGNITYLKSLDNNQTMEIKNG